VGVKPPISSSPKGLGARSPDGEGGGPPGCPGPTSQHQGGVPGCQLHAHLPFPPLVPAQAGGAGGCPGAPTPGTCPRQIRVKAEPGSGSVPGGLGGGMSVWLPAQHQAPAYASRHTVSFPFSTPCNWAHATASSQDANDMLIRKLGSNLSLALMGLRAALVLHPTPLWAPASHPTAGSCIPPHHRLLHPTPLWAPASHPTAGSCIPPHGRALLRTNTPPSPPCPIQRPPAERYPRPCRGSGPR